MFQNSDVAKLILRVSLGGLTLFHGVNKLIHGIGGVKSMVVSSGLPEFVSYGVYVGELIAPLFIALGLYARVASAILGVNMLVAIYFGVWFRFFIIKAWRFGDGIAFDVFCYERFGFFVGKRKVRRKRKIVYGEKIYG